MNASPRKISENTKCRSWAYWVPVLLYAAGIFYLSSRPSPDIPPPFPHFDKLVHLVMYAGLSFFVARALCYQLGRVDRFVLWASIVMSSLYGMTDELHQYFVPTRSCDVLDWCADVVGSVVGIFIYAAFNYWLLGWYFKKSTY